MKKVLLLLVAMCTMLVMWSGVGSAADFRIGWDSNCYHTKWQVLDPIGGATHLHEFTGTSPDANSTPATMINENSNCLFRAADTSGYWVPAVFDPDNNVAKKAKQAAAYYRTTVEPADVTVPPFGLKVVAGDSHSTTQQGQDIVRWSCIGPTGDETGVLFADAPFNCGGNYSPRVNINFPQCWNGVDLDSADHKSHMAYPEYNASLGVYKCPASHPRAIPRLNLQHTFYNNAESGVNTNWQNVVFASGGRFSWHADWWNTMSYASSDPNSMPNLVFNCIKQADICGSKGTT